MVFAFPARKAEDNKEQNEVSGSKGEANFVWRCKSCKVGHRVNQTYSKLLTWDQRESTATVKNPPQAYTHASPPKRQKIIEFDCRGLEFVEFKSDVGRGMPQLRAAWLTAW